MDDGVEILCGQVLALMPTITRTEPAAPRPLFTEFAGMPKAGKSFIA
jgi:hypothetical protein